MSFNIIPIASFSKELKRLAKKHPSLKTDFAELLDILEVTPRHGTPIGEKLF